MLISENELLNNDLLVSNNNFKEAKKYIDILLLSSEDIKQAKVKLEHSNKELKLNEIYCQDNINALTLENNNLIYNYEDLINKNKFTCNDLSKANKNISELNKQIEKLNINLTEATNQNNILNNN